MTTIKINGMKCGHCVSSVTKAMEDIKGISNVNVNLEEGEVTFDQANPIAKETIQETILGIGFEVV